MAKELLTSDSDSDSDSSDVENGGTELSGTDFKVNEEFAKRFEFNKRREEVQRLEEKFGKSTPGKRKREQNEAESNSSSDESSSEDEDEGELATAAVDSEIIATIAAIKSKDPRVYDSGAKFYTTLDDNSAHAPKTKAEKPMHLRDYHRQNLLNGNGEVGDEEQPLTYDQEQEQLKKSVLAQMHAAAEGSETSEAEDNFLVAKGKPQRLSKDTPLDVENAEKDPETFLTNFMSSRAWAQEDDRQLQPFESDDEDEDKKADEFEEAYNFRFEDPAKSNEKLQSHARDLATKYSVRRDETNPRQRKREAEKTAKAAAKLQLREEKARLRKLKVDEVEEKVKRIKETAGLSSRDLQPEDWQRFVDEDWDDAQWDAEMQKRFGEDYYAEEDAYVDGDDDTEQQSRKPKKPKFDDDIDVKDIIPDFDDEDEKPEFSLSDEDLPDVEAPVAKKQKKTKEEQKRESKRERRIIEQLVDDQLQLELEHALPKSSKNRGAFRYRETSPKSFGLTSRDILLADDAQLNQFAGLKKLAAYRDQERKRKDQKHLGKKARLRKWRLDTFGSVDGPPQAEPAPPQSQNAEEGDGEQSVKTKRRRKSKKQKTAAV